MKTSFTQNLKVLILALLIGLGVGSVSGDWSAPPGNPPACPDGVRGCDAPVHTGVEPQIRQAGLTVGAGSGVSVGFAVLNGDVGIGTSEPTTKLDVDGTIMANDADPNALWGGEMRFATGEAAPAYGNLRMEKDAGTWGLRFGSSDGSLMELESHGNIEVIGGKVKSPEICIGSDCRTTWPAGGGGGTAALTCAEGARTANNAVVTIAGSSSAFQSVGTANGSDQNAIWGLRCINGYTRMSCSLGQSSGINGGDVNFGNGIGGYSGANYCLTDNEEAASTMYIQCCKLN